MTFRNLESSFFLSLVCMAVYNIGQQRNIGHEPKTFQSDNQLKKTTGGGDWVPGKGTRDTVCSQSLLVHNQTTGVVERDLEIVGCNPVLNQTCSRPTPGMIPVLGGAEGGQYGLPLCQRRTWPLGMANKTWWRIQATGEKDQSYGGLDWCPVAWAGDNWTAAFPPPSGSAKIDAWSVVISRRASKQAIMGLDYPVTWTGSPKPWRMGNR